MDFVILSFIPLQLSSIIKQNVNLVTEKEEARISNTFFNVKSKAVALRVAGLLGFLGFFWVDAFSRS